MFAAIYFNDALVFSQTEQDHADHLQWGLEKLGKHYLKVKRKKSALGLNELQYLGHVIEQNTVSMDPRKYMQLQSGQNFKCPQSV